MKIVYVVIERTDKWVMDSDGDQVDVSLIEDWDGFDSYDEAEKYIAKTLVKPYTAKELTIEKRFIKDAII